MVKIFKRKDVPLVTKGRILHAVFGAAVVMLLGLATHFFSWGTFGQGAQWGMVVAFLYGMTWEFMTPVMAKIFNWGHPFGDFIDLMAYWFGSVATAVPLIYLKFLEPGGM